MRGATPGRRGLAFLAAPLPQRNRFREPRPVTPSRDGVRRRGARVDYRGGVLYLLRPMTRPGVGRRGIGGSSFAPALRGARLGRGRLLPAVLTLGAVVGCGGGAPLLHPAHPLPVDTVSCTFSLASCSLISTKNSGCMDAFNCECLVQKWKCSVRR